MSAVAVNSREFLTVCLKAALDDQDLVDAISDQAFEQGFSAESIARGQVTVDDIKDKLFLTMEEAKSVLNMCTSMLAGANKVEPQDKLSVNLRATPSGRLTLSLGNSNRMAQIIAAEAPTDDVLMEPVPFEPLDAMLDNAAVVVVSRAPTNASQKKLQAIAENAPEGFFPPAPPPAPEAAPVRAPAAVSELTPPASPEVSTTSCPPAALADANPSAGTPLAAKSPAARQPSTSKLPPAPIPIPKSPAASAPSAKPPAPSSPAPKSQGLPPSATKSPGACLPVAKSPATTASPGAKSPAIAKPSELLMPEPCLSSPRLPSTAAASPSTPSYLRATAAHKARTSKDGTVSATASPATSSLPPVSEESPADLNRRRQLFSRMTSTLLAPTQAFVARVTGRSEEVKSKKESAVSKSSLQLESVLCSPQGQRVTKPQPFQLRSEARAKSCVLSTEELQLIEAKEKAFKRKPVPKHVHESRPIVPVQRSAPKDPNTVFEPFQLASIELHKKKMEKMKQQQQEAAAREEQARQFKARAFDAKKLAESPKPAKPPASPPTRAVAPVLASEARIAHYHAVIEPAKKAKEAEKDREKTEAEQKAKELEGMCLDDFRKTLEFKARPMPDFSAPFQVDPSLARPATMPVEPELHTVKRLGAAPAPTEREDKEGGGLGKGVYDGAGYADPFIASLRKSTSSSSRTSSNGPAKGTVASLRRSAMSRQSSGLASHNSGRSSVGADLQAAIRAAARDAARDLAAAGCSVDSDGMAAQ